MSIQELITKNNTEQAIFEMKKTCINKISEISVLEAKYNALKKSNLIGAITFQEFTQGMAQVNYGLLEILKESNENNKSQNNSENSIDSENRTINQFGQKSVYIEKNDGTLNIS
jgi:hypothetical protein